MTAGRGLGMTAGRPWAGRVRGYDRAAPVGGPLGVAEA